MLRADGEAVKLFGYPARRSENPNDISYNDRHLSDMVARTGPEIQTVHVDANNRLIWLKIVHFRVSVFSPDIPKISLTIEALTY